MAKLPVIHSGEPESKFSSKGNEQKPKKKGDEQNQEEGLKLFSKDAYWKELFALEEAVEEPANPLFKKPHGPTEEEGKIPVKHNFDVTFDVPVFTGKVKRKVMGRNGIIKKNEDRTL